MTEVTAKKVILKDKNGQYLIPYTDNNLNNPYTLFDSKYSEAPLYNASWLLSNGTYYSKSVYVTAYEALVVENNTEIDAGTSVQLPSGTTYIKRGLSVKLSTAEDITDYDFVINTTDEKFKLPLKSKIIPLTGESLPVKGNGIALGMMTYDGDTPHYYGTYEFGTNAQLDIQAAVYGMSVGDTSITNINVYPVGRHAAGITDDATKSGMIADISNMDLSDLNLYYYVGETVQNAHLIDAAQIAGNIADKANADLSNCTKPYVTETYVNGTSWYRLWSDGWCEQGGQTAALSASTQTTIELLKEYSNTDYFINVNQPLRIGDQLPTVGIYQKNTANFIVHQSSSSNKAGAYATLWYACGF